MFRDIVAIGGTVLLYLIGVVIFYCLLPPFIFFIIEFVLHRFLSKSGLRLSWSRLPDRILLFGSVGAWILGTCGEPLWFRMTSQVIQVPAGSKKTETSIYAEPGDVYELRVSGKIHWTDDPMYGDVGYEGTPFPASQTGNDSGLIGRWPRGALIVESRGLRYLPENHLKEATGWPPLFGQERLVLRAGNHFKDKERLAFSVNDNQLQDNTGFFTVYIKKLDWITDAPYSKDYSLKSMLTLDGDWHDLDWQYQPVYIPPRCRLELFGDVMVGVAKIDWQLGTLATGYVARDPKADTLAFSSVNREDQSEWPPLVLKSGRPLRLVFRSEWRSVVLNRTSEGKLSYRAMGQAPKGDFIVGHSPVSLKIGPLPGIQTNNPFPTWMALQIAGLMGLLSWVFILIPLRSWQVFRGGSKVGPATRKGTGTMSRATPTAVRRAEESPQAMAIKATEHALSTLETTHEELAQAVQQAMQQGFHDIQERSQSWWQSRNLKTVMNRRVEGLKDLSETQRQMGAYIGEVNATLDNLKEFYSKTGQSDRLPYLDRLRDKLEAAKLEADIAEQESRKATAERLRRDAEAPPTPPAPEPRKPALPAKPKKPSVGEKIDGVARGESLRQKKNKEWRVQHAPTNDLSQCESEATWREDWMKKPEAVYLPIFEQYEEYDQRLRDVIE